MLVICFFCFILNCKFILLPNWSFQNGRIIRMMLVICFFCFTLNCKIILLTNWSFQNGRISSMDFHRASNYLVTASDDESIRLYDVANATYDSSNHYICFCTCFSVLSTIFKSHMRWIYPFLHLMVHLSVDSTSFLLSLSRTCTFIWNWNLIY